MNQQTRHFGWARTASLQLWSTGLLAALFISSICTSSQASPVVLAPERPSVVDETAPVRALFKFVKAEGAKAQEPAAVFLPESCAGCKAMNDANFDRNNLRETLVGLWMPRRRTLELRFAVVPGAVKRVLLQTGDLPFRTEGNQIVVSVPPLWHDVVAAAEMSTHLVEPGVVLRLEHGDPQRRAGKYSDGLFPVRQRMAADNLQFALREFIRTSGLGRYVADQRLGAIMLMGFDTNLPFGHVDYPPHFHMHLRWPASAGTQIAHFYIDEAALLGENIVGIRDVGAKQRTYVRGETFTTFDMHGRPVYSLTVTPQGALKVARAGQTTCDIRPVAAGFDSGAVLDCPGREAMTIKVTANLSKGVMAVQAGNSEEVFRIDPDTGWLLSATKPPLPPHSAYVPPDY